MTVPRDGLPVNLPPNVQAMLDELAQEDSRPVLVLRRRSCGCELGAVYRLKVGRLLMGERRALVKQTLDRAQARVQGVALDVDDLPGDFMTGEVSCQHGAPLLDRAALLAAFDGATRLSTVHLLD